MQRPGQENARRNARICRGGSAFRWRNTTLAVPGHKKLRIPPTARYFSGVTAAGVRSNVFDTTLLYPHNQRSDPYFAMAESLGARAVSAVPARRDPGSF